MAKDVYTHGSRLGIRVITFTFLSSMLIGVLLPVSQLRAEVQDRPLEADLMAMVTVTISLLGIPIFLGLFAQRLWHATALSVIAGLAWSIGLIGGLYLLKHTALTHELPIPAARAKTHIPAARAWLTVPVWIVLSAIVSSLRGVLIRSRTAQHASCLCCGYKIGVDDLQVCPECGRSWDANESAPRWPGRLRPIWLSTAFVGTWSSMAGIICALIFLRF